MGAGAAGARFTLMLIGSITVDDSLRGAAPRHPNGTSRNATKDTSPTRVTNVAPA